MGTLNRSISRTVGLMTTAISMIFSPNTSTKDLAFAHSMKQWLDNSYRTIKSHGKSTAAAHKRAARKLQNIRARAPK